MKTIYEHAVGGDGATFGLYVDGDSIVEQVRYPLAKALAPADQFVDASINALEAKVGWAKTILDPLRDAAKAELAKITVP